MIRRRDQVRMSLRKLGLRKKRAAFAIISVALGTVVLVAVNSLMAGARDWIVNTNLTESLDPHVIMVRQENPMAYMQSEEERKQTEKKRVQFLNDAVLVEIRKWPGVEAVEKFVTVTPVSVDVFAKRPRPPWQFNGVPEALLRHYISDPSRLTGSSNAIPIVVGERNVRLHYDPKLKKLLLDPPDKAASWIGRDVVLTVGYNFAGVDRFSFDYEKKEFNEVTDDEYAMQRDEQTRTYQARFDLAVYQTTLPLKGRIVGICPGRQLLMPQETADQCANWIMQRNQLASLGRLRTGVETVYESRGRMTARTGEFTEATVVIKPGADAEAMAKKIDALGFYGETRARTFEEQAKTFEGVVKTVKKIVYALAGVLAGLACGLIWSTISRIVADSRADIGLFRALGATKQDIRRLFLGEAALLGMLGTLVGTVLGWMLAKSVSNWVIAYARRDEYDPESALLIPDSIFAVDLKFCAMLLVAAALLSFLAGLWPANRAAAVDPVKALKRE